jgi:hypothetical protein
MVMHFCKLKGCLWNKIKKTQKRAYCKASIRGFAIDKGSEHENTVSQAYFALHKTLHKVLGKKYFLVLRLPLRHF